MKAFVVERYDFGEWIYSSDHGDKDYAIYNADVISKSRKCRARVLEAGELIYEPPWDKLSELFDG